MKKTLLALFLALTLLVSAVPFTVSAGSSEVTTYTCNFDVTKPSGYASSTLLGGAEGTRLGESGYSAYANVPTQTQLAEPRRTKLIQFGTTIPAGTYDMSIWVCDPNNILKTAGADLGTLLTFHSSDLTDEDLAYNWNTKSNGVAKIYDVKDTDEKNNKGFAAYTGSKVKLAPVDSKVDGSKTWYKYAGNITLTADSSQVAFWLYLVGTWGYNNTANSVNTGLHVFFDDLTLTPAEAAPKTYEGNFNTAAGGYSSGLINAETDTVWGPLGKSISMYHSLTNSFGNTTTTITVGSDTNVIANGTRRSQLISLSETVPAGTYDMSIWVCDPNGSLDPAKKFNIGALLTFHSDDVTDASLKLDWNNSSNSNSVVKIFDTTTDAETGKTVDETNKVGFAAYSSMRSKLTPAESVTLGGKTWVNYTGTVTLDKASSKVALWLYAWTGYQRDTAMTANDKVYIDNLTLTSKGAAVANCEFDDSIAGYAGTGMLNKASGTRWGDTGASAYFMPTLSALGSDDTNVPQNFVDITGIGKHLTNGTRRLKLVPLSKTVTKGTYNVSIWVADPSGLMTRDGSEFGALLTFHSDDVTDNSLAYDWNNRNFSNGVAKVFDTSNDKDAELDGNNFANYEGSKVKLAPTGQTNGKFSEYAGTITLTKDSTQVGLWMYMWAGYENVPSKSGENVYFDHLVLSAAGESEAIVTPYEENVTTVSISLDEQVGVNFYTDLEVAAEEKGIEISEAEVVANIGGYTLTLGDADDFVNAGNKITVTTSPSQLNDYITVTLTDGKNTAVIAKDYTVYTYCDYMIKNSKDEKVVNVCKALVNYARVAQEVFDDGISDVDISKVSYDLDLDSIIDTATVFADSETYNREMLSFLALDKSGVRFYYNPSLGEYVSIDDANGFDTSSGVVNGYTLDGKMVANALNYVQVEKIDAVDLNTSFTVTVNGQTLAYSALQCVYDLATIDSDYMAFYNALDQYYQAAVACFN